MLKRRLNPFLIAITILVLSLLAGLSVMYSGVIEDKVEKTKDLNETIKQKNQEISRLKAAKANLSQELNNKEGDVNRWTSIARERKQEISDLNDKISDLEDEKSGLKSEVDRLENVSFQTNLTLADMNSTLEDICDADNNTVSGGDEKCNEWGHEFDGSEPQ